MRKHSSSHLRAIASLLCEPLDPFSIALVLAESESRPDALDVVGIELDAEHLQFHHRAQPIDAMPPRIAPGDVPSSVVTNELPPRLKAGLAINSEPARRTRASFAIADSLPAGIPARK